MGQEGGIQDEGGTSWTLSLATLSLDLHLLQEADAAEAEGDSPSPSSRSCCLQYTAELERQGITPRAVTRGTLGSFSPGSLMD